MSRSQWWSLLPIVSLLLVGCIRAGEYPGEISVSDGESHTGEVEAYLEANVGIASFGGQVFCAHEVLDAQQSADRQLFLWALCLEYKLEQGVLQPGSGVSGPVMLQLEEQGELNIVSFSVPRDGAYYGPDIRAIFPRGTWDQILPRGKDGTARHNERVGRLQAAISERVERHFSVGTE